MVEVRGTLTISHFHLDSLEYEADILAERSHEVGKRIKCISDKLEVRILN